MLRFRALRKLDARSMRSDTLEGGADHPRGGTTSGLAEELRLPVRRDSIKLDVNVIYVRIRPGVRDILRAGESSDPDRVIPDDQLHTDPRRIRDQPVRDHVTKLVVCVAAPHRDGQIDGPAGPMLRGLV